MRYIVNKDGSLNAFHFSIKGVEYLITGTDGTLSENAWGSLHTIKRIDNRVTKNFYTHEMKDWKATIINDINITYL